MIEDLSSKINDGGNIVVGYLYDIENEEDGRDIYQSSIRDAIFKEKEYSYDYVKRMHDLHRNRLSNNHDAVLIYTKK